MTSSRLPAGVVAFTLELPTTGPVRLEILDLRGRLVRTLVDGTPHRAGDDVVWDGRDDRGTTVASGVYTARLHLGERTAATKVTILK